MEKNGTTISKQSKKIYSREILKSLQNSELSRLWPASLDKNCINSNNQWDPVKSFENSKSTPDARRAIFTENKSGYRNNDKSKDDISLRPERRRWNDGCQVTNSKRNGDDNNQVSYRKPFPNYGMNSGSGDYERNRFNRNSNRSSSVKIKDSDKMVSNSISNKLEKSSRNNSNIDEGNSNGTEEQKMNSKPLKACQNPNRHSEPEWFIDGPDNFEDTIELRGITDNDNEMLNFKAVSTKSHEGVVIANGSSEDSANRIINEKSMLNLCMEKSLKESGTSPKREGSRFQDIFLKEKQINHFNEFKDVENILKAVLSDKASKSDVERLNNVSKPLPNGVLTLEEIEKNITSNSTQMNRATSKSATIETLNSFEPSLNSLLSSGLSSPSQDNSKVVNWLSGLNLHMKDQDMGGVMQPPYIDPPNQCNLNAILNSPSQLSAGYSKFINNLPPPPGLPLILNTNQLQQHQHQQHQHQQHPHYSQVMQQNKLLQSGAIMKHIQNSQPNNINHNVQPRNILPYMCHQHNAVNDFEGFVNDRFNLNNLSNESQQVDQNFLSNLFMKNSSQINHHLKQQQERNQVMSMNSPPGLTNLNLFDRHLLMQQPRPIVKTSSPQMVDLSNEFNKTFQNHFSYYRGMSANNPVVNNLQNIDLTTSPTIPMSQMEMYNNRNREFLQKQSMAMKNIQNRQSSFMSSNAHDINFQNSSSSNKMLTSLFNMSSSTLPPLPQQAKYAEQIETENI